MTNEDFEIGHYIRQRIIPRAVLFFTGKTLIKYLVPQAVLAGSTRRKAVFKSKEQCVAVEGDLIVGVNDVGPSSWRKRKYNGL